MNEKYKDDIIFMSFSTLLLGILIFASVLKWIEDQNWTMVIIGSIGGTIYSVQGARFLLKIIGGNRWE